MFHLFPAAAATRTSSDAAAFCSSRLSRRELTTTALTRMAALASVTLAERLQLAAAENSPSAEASLPSVSGGKAKSCISIFLCGGPSQPDLWDMKPEAPVGIRSEFQPIQTTVPDIYFGELIPRVARHADKLALIRSMTHSNNDHNGAIVHSLLGQLPSVPDELYVDRNDHPGIGAILQKLLGNSAPLPAWVVLPRFFGTNSPAYKGQSGGFLGPSFDPLLFDKERIGSLSEAPLRIGSLELPADVSPGRFRNRFDLLRSLENVRDRSGTGTGEPADAGSTTAGGRTARADSSEHESAFVEQAESLLADSRIRSAFLLDAEPQSVRDRYGRNEYGQSFLMARRLIESGVRHVNVFWTFFDSKGCQFNLWDNHGVPNDVCGIDGQLTGRQQLTHRYCTPSFDQSFSALLEDMSQRGLLDETLITVGGEFGRTPRINATAGRDHWAHCYTQLLAGGGVQGGSVYGRSDAQGAYVRDLPVTPDDLAATVLHAFGLSPELTIPDHTGRPVRITTGRPVTAIF
ncbi:MAG: DUF1501 domain-containing protein [Planctomyces sp.]|jgi:hypothetical protein